MAPFMTQAVTHRVQLNYKFKLQPRDIAGSPTLAMCAYPAHFHITQVFFALSITVDGGQQRTYFLGSFASCALFTPARFINQLTLN